MSVQNISLDSRLHEDVLAVLVAVLQGDGVRVDHMADREDVRALPRASVAEQWCTDLSA